MTENKLEIILYHGSLEELNERSEQQYTFAQDVWYYLRVVNTELHEALESLKSSLSLKGHHGLVNMKTSITKANSYEFHYLFEGTPLVKLNLKNK